MRRLNSYQDWYQQCTQFIDLLYGRAFPQVTVERLNERAAETSSNEFARYLTHTNIPSIVAWNSLMAARKAAYDASFFDPSHRERTKVMQGVTLMLHEFLVGPYAPSVTSTDEDRLKCRQLLETFTERFERVRAEFAAEESLAMPGPSSHWRIDEGPMAFEDSFAIPEPCVPPAPPHGEP